MDRKTIAIGILSVTAALLLCANSYTVHRAEGYAVKDQYYQVVTANAIAGGQVLYVTDNRSGQVAVFSWDSAAKTLRVRARQSMADLLGSR